MDYFKPLVVYLFYLTVCLATKGHVVDFPSTNTTKSIVHKSVEDRTEHSHRKGRDNPTETKNVAEMKPICIDPKAQVKVQLTAPNPKSMPIPINFLIDNKPRTIPTKIPLVIKTANAKPAPAHYVRLKTNQDQKNTIKPKIEINLNLNKPNANVKVAPPNIIIPKPVLNLALQNRNENIPRKKIKSVDFYEDTNYESLPPALKSPGTKKNKKLENNNNISKEFEIESDVKAKSYEFETESDNSNEVVHIRNGTHHIRITKLPQTDSHDTGHQHSKKPHDHSLPSILPSIPLSGLVAPLITKKEEPIALIINKDGVETAIEQAGVKVEPIQPIDAPNPVGDTPDIITITNHNYEEVEERSGAYPENNINEEKLLWTSPSRPIAPKNPYNQYLHNLQVAYDQYVKYIADNNPAIYKAGNCYPRVDAPDVISATDADSTQTYSPPSETQSVQDVYFGQKPDYNNVDIRPENNLGRIWRTWKDTEIKISKPNAFLNKALELGRSLNNFNDMNFGEYSKPPLYSAPIGLNGYYDNLNNQLTYPYSYPTYRYMY